MNQNHLNPAVFAGMWVCAVSPGMWVCAVSAGMWVCAVSADMWVCAAAENRPIHISESLMSGIVSHHSLS